MLFRSAVLRSLGVKAYEDNVGEWCNAKIKHGSLTLSSRTMYEKSVPNVIGMGARDAVYALESKGLKVRISGRGKVVSQSASAGSSFVKGQTVTLRLN